MRPDDDRWTEVLDRCQHDFYHLPGYVEVSAREDRGEPRALLVEEDEKALLLPLVMRPLPDGFSDATSPYGYPGPITSADGDEDWLERAMVAGERHLAEQGAVTLFVRLHPLLNSSPPGGCGTVVQHGDTVTIDLSLPEEEQWRNVRRNHRQQIRQALAAGYEVVIDDDLEHYDDFRHLYLATMRRLEATDYYFFDGEYFDRLRKALGRRLHLAYAAIAGEIAAAALFVKTGGIVQIHLTGHAEEYAKDQPMKLVFDRVRTWSNEHGATALHLGGGRGGVTDSLLHFKAGFSKVRQPFYTVRCVVDPIEYRRHMAAVPSADPDDLTGPFPAYHRPVAG
jgi:hypothetical protein